MTKDYWLALALALCATLIRTQGILLIVAIVIVLALRRAWQAVAIFATSGTAVFLLFGMSKTHAHNFWLKNPYNEALGRVGVGDLVARVTHNFGLYAWEILPETLLPWTAWQGVSVLAGVVLMFLIWRGIK